MSEEGDGEVVEYSSRLLRVDGVAALLGCSPRTVYNLHKAGKIPPCIRLGGAVRWDRGVLERWFDDGCPELGQQKGDDSE